jgi:hypothetical protein
MRTAVLPVTTLRSSLAQRRSSRRAEQRLARELAAYDTEAARLELAAILERHSAAEVAPIERILRRQSAARLWATHR